MKLAEAVKEVVSNWRSLLWSVRRGERIRKLHHLPPSDEVAT